MKSLTIMLVAGISAVAFASAVQAADLVIDEAPVVIPGVVESTGNFDGLFVGVFGGYALGSLEFDVPAAPPGAVPDFDPEGWQLGVDAGVNFSLGNGIVMGVVGDIAWANIEDSLSPSLDTEITSTIDWLGSLRGRVGFDAGSFMPYLTAGLAFAHNTVEATDSGAVPAVSVSDDQMHIGWTVGAGVEFAVSENLSLDASYRYNDYGDATYTGTGFGGLGEVDAGITSHQLSVGLHLGF